MPIDAPVIARIAQEIKTKLPLKVDKIYQPYADEFYFSAYGNGESLKILISLNAQYGRIHFFEGEREIPFTPSAFCILLRKHFGNAKLVAVEAVPFERIIKLTFEAYDQLTGLNEKLIWVEMTGKSANLVLTTADGRIIDAWRHSNANKPGDRELTVGTNYELPSTGGRWQPVTIDLNPFITLLKQVPVEVSLDKFLLKHWYGLSNLAINEITRSAGLTPASLGVQLSSEQIAALFTTFTNWASTIRDAQFNPHCLYDAQDRLIDCWALPIQFPEPNLTSRAVVDLNPILASLFNQRHEVSRFNETKQNLLRQIKILLDKNRVKIEKQQAEAVAADQGDQWRISGELLSTYGFSIAKGATEARLVNHYDLEAKELVIPLNPALSAQENAQFHFKKYQKAKKGQLAIAAQILRTQNDLDYLESLEALVLNAETDEDLKLVREELELAKPGKKRVLPKKGNLTKKEPPAKPRQYTTPAGHQLLVGRNNLQNDKLTFKIALPTDWWFHTQKIPGSHVILRPLPGMPVDEASLNLACQLAAYFSKARKSSKVPVDYTQRKYVKKPPGAKPGFVIYDNFKSAIITPDLKLLKEIGVIIE